jgi:hypothetical protein
VIRSQAILVTTCAVLLALTAASVGIAASQSARPERFTAMAVLPPGAGPVTTVEFVIQRWSTPVESERVMTAVTELGTRGMLQALLKLPEVGSISTIGSTGYPIRYASKTTGADGVDHIILAMDRPIGFVEMVNQGRSLDYPITIIQMHVKPGTAGTGTGEIDVAVKVQVDPVSKALVIENFDFVPVALQSVRRVK